MPFVTPPGWVIVSCWHVVLGLRCHNALFYGAGLAVLRGVMGGNSCEK